MGIFSRTKKEPNTTSFERVLANIRHRAAARYEVLALAFGELGQREIVGKLHNPRILEYHQTTGLKAGTDEVPWCSSFVNWVLEGLNYERTKSAAARSWEQYPEKTDPPTPGDIIVFSRGNNPRQGHVGFYLADHAGQVYVLGGNQGNQVSVATYPQSRVVHVVDLLHLVRLEDV